MRRLTSEKVDSVVQPYCNPVGNRGDYLQAVTVEASALFVVNNLRITSQAGVFSFTEIELSFTCRFFVVLGLHFQVGFDLFP